MPAISYELAGQSFGTKKHLTNHLKLILAECQEGGRPMSSEEIELVTELARQHPDFEEKAGEGMTTVTVMQDPQYGSPCFGIVRANGVWIDFSYKKCF